MKTYLSILTIALIALFMTANSVQAQVIPTFPTCLNPQGSIKASNTGTHGVPGDYATYEGIDVVYQLTADTVTQCLCPANGNGVQTNWWKVSALTETEVNKLKADGWVYIPTGIVWGLDDAPYVAQNLPYSCLAKGGGPGPTSTPSSNGGGGGGSTTNNVTNITNNISQVLASTGNIKSVYLYAVSGLLLIAAGIYSLRVKKN
ncbi:hypothetical protein BH09PAT2_BH09PAT2_02040 [soil metagenome]